MKIGLILSIGGLALMAGCASEFEIAASDVPEPVMRSFSSKYPLASDTEWEVEKVDGKLYFEAEFKIEGKKKEAYFRPDGTFSKEE